VFSRSTSKTKFARNKRAVHSPYETDGKFHVAVCFRVTRNNLRARLVRLLFSRRIIVVKVLCERVTCARFVLKYLSFRLFRASDYYGKRFSDEPTNGPRRVYKNDGRGIRIDRSDKLFVVASRFPRRSTHIWFNAATNTVVKNVAYFRGTVFCLTGAGTCESERTKIKKLKSWYEH